MTIQTTADHINQINTVVQQVAAAASVAQATTGTAPTNAEKLQAAVTIATTLNPQLAALVTPLETLISNAVSLFNIFKLFGAHNNPTSTPVAVEAAPATPAA